VALSQPAVALVLRLRLMAPHVLPDPASTSSASLPWALCSPLCPHNRFLLAGWQLVQGQGQGQGLRAEVSGAECRCSRRPRPPPGAACCRPRAGDAWPAVTGPPAVAAGAARRRPPSAGAFRRWCNAAKQSSTTASAAPAFARQQHRQPEQ